MSLIRYLAASLLGFAGLYLAMQPIQDAILPYTGGNPFFIVGAGCLLVIASLFIGGTKSKRS